MKKAVKDERADHTRRSAKKAPHGSHALAQTARARLRHEGIESRIRRRRTNKQTTVQIAIAEGRGLIEDLVGRLKRWPVFSVGGRRFDPETRNIKVTAVGRCFDPVPNTSAMSPAAAAKAMAKWERQELKAEQLVERYHRDAAKVLVEAKADFLGISDLRGKMRHRWQVWRTMDEAILTKIAGWPLDPPTGLPSVREYQEMMRRLRSLTQSSGDWGWSLCARDECLAPFIPRSKGSITCSEACNRLFAKTGRNQGRSVRRARRNEADGDMASVATCSECIRRRELCPEHDHALDVSAGVHRSLRPKLAKTPREAEELFR